MNVGLNGLLGFTTNIIESIQDTLMHAVVNWLYEMIFDAISDFFRMMGNMGSRLFNLPWVQATINLFTMFGWALFVAGCVVAILDFALEYQSGRANIKGLFLNVLKGFFACSLIGVVPVELYRLCVSLQDSLGHDLTRVFTGTNGYDLGAFGLNIMQTHFKGGQIIGNILFLLLALIAYGYCAIKVFFQNIKRGGILLVQISVGSLYMFSIPRGYTDGFVQWMKQVVAMCLTAFMQTTLLFLGFMTFQADMLLGLGVMLAAGEVPRIAQQFGLDSTTHVNVTNIMHSATTAMQMSRTMIVNRAK